MFTPPASVAAAIEATLDDECTITRLGASTFTAGQDLQPGAPTTVYEGACSVSAPKQITRSAAGGDDRTVDARTIRLLEPIVA